MGSVPPENIPRSAGAENTASHISPSESSACSSSQAVDVHTLGYLAQVLTQEKAVTQVEGLKLEMKSLLDRVQGITDATNDSEVLKAGIMHVKNAVSIMEALPSGSTTTLPVKEKIASNANNVVQPRFASTKKKRSRLEIHSKLSKPTALESESCRLKLLSVEVRVCALCFKEDDKVEKTPTVQWIQCTQCSIWVHSLCASDPTQLHTDTFICNWCSE
jgi:hypothetical protein